MSHGGFMLGGDLAAQPPPRFAPSDSPAGDPGSMAGRPEVRMASGFEAVAPIAGFAFQVGDGIDGDGIRFDAIDELVGEALNRSWRALRLDTKSDLSIFVIPAPDRCPG